MYVLLPVRIFFIRIIMAVAMVAMLAFGGTYAYFTATAQGLTATGTTGTISLKNDTATATFTKANILPGETEDVTLTLTEGSNRGSWVFFTSSCEVTPASGTINEGELSATLSAITVTGFEVENFDNEGTTVYAIKIEEAAAATTTQLVAKATVTVAGTATNANGAGHAAMGATIEVTINASSIQLSAGATAAAAYANLGK